MVFRLDTTGNKQSRTVSYEFQVSWNWNRSQSSMRLQQLPSNSEQPITVTLRVAARRLSVCEMTIRRLLDSGSLERISIGRSVRVVAASIDRLIAKGGTSRVK